MPDMNRTIFCLLAAVALAFPARTIAQLSKYDVSWNNPGPTSAASMPLGNGDIGLNVWVDSSGDLLFYISKTDAWGGEKDTLADPWMQQGGVLMKLGLVRVHIPGADISHFRQTLHLHEGEIRIEEGNVGYSIWVDANHPVIRVEVSGAQPVSPIVTLQDWRLDGGGDAVLRKHGDPDRIVWFHHNPAKGDPRLADEHLADITFGAAIEAHGLSRKDDTTLSSTAATRTQLISIYPLTTMHGPWLRELTRQMASIGRLPLESTRIAHRQWWDDFWGRSYIYLHGDESADSVTQGYILQRFVTACAGRGAYPIKFNGSLFVTDNPEWKIRKRPAPMNADFRAWGGQYWFQNTRPMYWPRLAAGDFDLMLPWFRFYLRMLPGNAALVRKYYGHDGAYFQETSPFWGGVPFMGPNEKALYTHHYFTPILELSMMMLDYYEYTGDKQFLQQYLLPVASAGLEFFDRHFARDSEGKLLLDPDNSIEMFWKVHDPAPDIAGLHAVLGRMLQLDVADALKNRWRRLLSILPPLPIDSAGGAPRLLPYTGPATARSHNEENPELYAIYPFRLYGLDKPELEMARHSFDIRKCPQRGCWSQDPIEAAMLGYADVAKKDVAYNLTRRDSSLKFSAFWATGHDYKPDEDNGGNGEYGLQQMLLQTNGKKILLLPAWPAVWDADFKLHAPYNTTVEGKVRGGRLVDLVVTPAERRKDIVELPRHSATSRFTSYKGLVMAGYQGWFNAPDDGAGRGWNHYHAKGPLEDGNCKFDIWPDVSEYPKTYRSPFNHTDGSPAYLFSSYDASTTDLHFRWMQQYGIDGVFVQRFVGSVRSDPSRHHNNVVLEHALEASRKYGRAIAVMYDMSGMRDSVDVDVVINDWKYLVDSLRLTSRGDDQTYLYHNGKPLVAVWGAGFGDHRPYTSRSVERILDFLQHDPVYGGCAILLGVPTYWRDQGNDADKDPHWMDLFKRVDIIQPWMVGRYHEDTYAPFQERIKADIAWTTAHHEDYVPVVFPGFSWHNMYPNFGQNQIPRDRGRFFWKQIAGDIQAGAQMLYVAMFDEIDEGTAIFKASLNPPSGKSTFVTFEPGIPNDYYLQLAGYAARMLRKEVPFREEPPLPVGELTSYVDPFIGSGGHGHVFVGASVPSGAVQAGPQNIPKGWDWCSGYHYSDSLVIGFSQLHLSGTGIGDLGDVLIMPFTGEMKTGHGSLFSHAREKCRPGYYAVHLDDYNIDVELTASERVAFHRYHFPEGKTARAVIDLKAGINDRATDTHIERVDAYTLEGYRYSTGWAKDQRTYFAIRSDKPIGDFLTYADSLRQQCLISFGDESTVQLKVGLSPVSADNALANIEAEVPGWDFDAVVRKADEKWEKELEKIDISTSAPADKRIFYTALYHTMIDPMLYNDHNGDYLGTDKKVHPRAAFQNYTTFSLWDTYRALNPLYTLIQPERVNDIVNSFLAIYREQGILPVWHLEGCETHTMPGVSSVQVIAEAYLKGFRGFDTSAAWSAIKSTMGSDYRGMDYDRGHQFIPSDKVNESVARGLEYSISNASAALMAKKMGLDSDYAEFHARFQNYKRYWDPATQFFRGRMASGSWDSVFNPVKSSRPWINDLSEGNHWQYLWLVPEDVEGLIRLMGGEKRFDKRLDSLFTLQAPPDPNAPPDIAGLIGQYAHGDEPGHQTIYLYSYTGRQWQTAEKARFILQNLYRDSVDGLSGNEDCGQMSAWYIFSSLGFYPVYPAGGLYVLGSPLFDKATLHLAGGKTFTVETVNNGPTHPYIQRVTLNGQPYSRSYILHQTILDGGVMQITMGEQPNKRFGSAPADRPYDVYKP